VKPGDYETSIASELAALREELAASALQATDLLTEKLREVEAERDRYRALVDAGVAACNAKLRDLAVSFGEDPAKAIRYVRAALQPKGET
jgi:hypothetical protein